MPDVAGAERFIARIERLERRYVARAAQIWREARPRLLEALSRAQQPQQLVADVGRELASIGAQTAPQIAAEATLFAQDQVARTLGATPLLNTDSTPLAPLTQGLLAWQAAIVGRFLSDIGQLQAAGVEAPQIAVLATSAAPTGSAPISAWLWGLGALQLAGEGAVWSATNGTLRRAYSSLRTGDGEAYQKQAIAAIDGRTTPCCLRVHGQIQPLDEPFELNGRPAYSSRMQQPPFHHRCRTVIVLHSEAMEAVGPTTPALRASARAELTRRSPGRTR